MAQVVHHNAIITEARPGGNIKYPNTVYFTILDLKGTFNYSTETIPVDKLLEKRLQQATITVECAGRVFQNKQFLTAEAVDFKAIVPAKN